MPKKTSRRGGRSGRGLAASMLDKPIFHRLSHSEKMKVLELARIVEPDLFVTINNSNYMILLSEGEAFASEIGTSADVRIKTGSGKTTTVDYYVIT